MQYGDKPNVSSVGRKCIQLIEHTSKDQLEIFGLHPPLKNGGCLDSEDIALSLKEEPFQVAPLIRFDP